MTAKRIKTGKIIILFLMFSFTLTLRLYRLDFYSLWGDELQDVSFAKDMNIFNNLGSPHSPLGPLIIKFILPLSGNNEFWLRFPFAFAGAITGLVLYFFMKQEKDHYWLISLLPTFLLALSPIHIAHSQEVREYTFASLLPLLGSLFLILHQQQKRYLTLFGLIITTFLSLYNGFTGTVFFAVLGVIAFLSFLKNLIEKGKGKKAAIFLLTSFVLAVILFGLLNEKAYFSVIEIKFSLPQENRFNNLMSFYQSWFFASWICVAFFILGLIGSLFKLIKQKSCFHALIVFWILIPAVAVLFFFNDSRVLKWFIPALPISLVTLAVGTKVLVDLIHWKLPLSLRVKKGAVLILSLLIAFSAYKNIFPEIKAYYSINQPWRANWRLAGKYIERHLSPGDILIKESSANSDPERVAFYVDYQSKGAKYKPFPQKNEGKNWYASFEIYPPNYYGWTISKIIEPATSVSLRPQVFQLDYIGEQASVGKINDKSKWKISSNIDELNLDLIIDGKNDELATILKTIKKGDALQIDLGQIHVINIIELVNYNGFIPKNYLIEGSLDDQQWFFMGADLIDKTLSSTPKYHVPPRKTRFIRLTSLKDESYAWHIFEYNMYEVVNFDPEDKFKTRQSNLFPQGEGVEDNQALDGETLFLPADPQKIRQLSSMIMFGPPLKLTPGDYLFKFRVKIKEPKENVPLELFANVHPITAECRIITGNFGAKDRTHPVIKINREDFTKENTFVDYSIEFRQFRNGEIQFVVQTNNIVDLYFEHPVITRID